MKKYTLVRMVMLLALLVAGLTVAAVPGAAQTVTATLHIYGESVGYNPAIVHVHQITSEWTEGVTWASRPSYDSAVVDSFTSNTGWLSADITTLVQTWMAGSPNYGLLLEQDQTVFGYTRYWSTLGTYPPYLELCIDGSCETLAPVADAWIRENQPNFNGNDQYLYTGVFIGATSNYEKQSLLKFDIPVFPPPPICEGCTPGYWKNHLDSWEGYSPEYSFNTVFGASLDPDLTLLEALKARGPGSELLRHSVAALLNASNEGVDYALTEAEVFAAFDASDASTLVYNNELLCPLD
jgi:hypothetical protein